MENKPLKFDCKKFLGNISEKECSPGRYRDCKNCPQLLKPSTKSTQKKPAIHRNQHPKQKETIPLQKETKRLSTYEADFFSWDNSYCVAFEEKKGKKICRPGLYPVCNKCLKSKKPLRSESIKSSLSKILKVGELNKKTMSQLEECYWIVIASKSFDEKPKSSKIKAELKLVLDNAQAYAESLKNLTQMGEYHLEKELWKQDEIPAELKMALAEARKNNLEEEHYPEQLGGLKPCPECGKEFENIQDHIDHIKQCHPERERQITKNSTKDDMDLIERSLSDTCRICAAADKAIRKQPDVLEKGGRPIKIALKECVTKLSVIYFETTGEQPKSYYDKRSKSYKGSFCEFTQLFLSMVLKNPPTNSAIGQIIKEIYNIKKANSSPTPLR